MIIPIILVGNCFLVLYLINNFEKIINNPKEIAANIGWRILNNISKLRILAFKIQKSFENEELFKTQYLVLGIEDGKLKEYKFNNLDEWENYIDKLEVLEHNNDMLYAIQKEINDKTYIKFIDSSLFDNKETIFDIKEDEVVDNPFLMFSLGNKNDVHFEIKLNSNDFNICVTNNCINKNVMDILLKKQYNYLVKQDETMAINSLNSSMVYKEVENYEDFKFTIE